MHKKGYIKTIEAVVAIVFILGFIYMATPREKTDIGEEIPSNVKAAHNLIMGEFLRNDTLREYVAIGDEDSVDAFVSPNIPGGYDYVFEICSSTLSCTEEELPLKVTYVGSVFVATNITGQPRVVRLYIWPK